MTRHPLLALFLLVAAAGFGATELRGFVAALLTFAAGALVIDRVAG